MNKRTYVNSLGYTMLELLLVLSLVAVMALASIRWHRHHALVAIQQQAASDMQSMIAALMYYDSVENAWPDTQSCEAGDDINTESRFNSYYLPAGIQPSVYGSHYCWQEKTKDTTQPSGLLSLSLPIQGKRAAVNAQAVAALLPHAQAVSDTDSLAPCDAQAERCYVYTELVPQSGISGGAGAASLRGIGSCNPDRVAPCRGDEAVGQCCVSQYTSPITYQVTFPSCPSGYSLDVEYVPAYIKTPTQLHSQLHTASPMSLLDIGYIRGPDFYTGASAITDRQAEKEVSTCEVAGDHTVCHLPVGVGYYWPQKGASDMAHVPSTTDKTSSYLRGSAGAIYIAACQKESVLGGGHA